MAWRGKPEVIRCDDGPEYISATLLHWDSCQGIRIEHILLGKPQQNAYVERLNRTVRCEWLSQHYLSDLEEVWEFATQWVMRYNPEHQTWHGVALPETAAGHGRMALLLETTEFGGPGRAIHKLARANRVCNCLVFLGNGLETAQMAKFHTRFLHLCSGDADV